MKESGWNAEIAKRGGWRRPSQAAYGLRCARIWGQSLSSHARPFPAEASEHERKSALTWMRAVHRDLKNQDTSWPFVEPVNRDTTPLYYEIIRNPIDLKMIGQKIREKVRVLRCCTYGRKKVTRGQRGPDACEP